MEASLAVSPASSPVGKARPRAVGLRLWLWLLTPGLVRQTPAARLRGWARVRDWSDASTDRRISLVKRAVWTPVRAWKEARSAVERFGADVETVSGLPPRVQRRQLWWLMMRDGLDAPSYLDYQLYLTGRRRRASAYLQEREFYRVARWLHRAVPAADAYPIQNKRLFEDWCRGHDLAVTPTLLEYENGVLAVSRLPGDPVTTLPPCDLFSKPSDGTGGRGTARWRRVEPLGWMNRDGEVLPPAALLEWLARESGDSRRILLQPCLRNHPELLPLTPGGLCTVRVVTYRMPDGPAQVLLAAYKMPTGDSPADNFHFGGIVAPVDLSTGRLGPAIRRRGHVLVPVERHPDTGTVIPGHELPFWPETVDLAKRAMDAGSCRPTIGWDIAITEEGPVLVEGNTMSNPDIAQAPTGIPLSDTPFPTAIDAYMRRMMGM